MSALVRLANRTDAPLWVELVQAVLGRDYPAKQVYDLAWVGAELGAGDERETWLVENQGRLSASISFLKPVVATNNPVVNLGRCLFRPEAFFDGIATRLLGQVTAAAATRRKMAVARIAAADQALQKLFEQGDYTCVGYQSAKHLQPTRHGVLFYVHGERPALASRLPLSCSLPQVGELCAKVLRSMGMELPLRIEDGATGYPLQALVEIVEGTGDQFEAHCFENAERSVPAEISTGSHRGSGLLRVEVAHPRAVLARRGAQTTGGVLYVADEHDRCVRILNAFSTDDLSLGPLLFRVMSLAQEKFSAAYVEMDVLSTAPRLLKTAEQLGFVPVAYFPGFNEQVNRHVDVIKMAKLNVPYAPEAMTLSAQARDIVLSVHAAFEDQKSGVAIINLLRALNMFQGLGDGELRKVAKLFEQKLFRPGDTLFVQGGHGNEAFIVLRGQVDIMFDDPPRPVASVGPGQIFGEQAFLDGAPRTATAEVVQPTILLVMQRSAFHDLAQREPHLGLVVMRNIAVELSSKLRKTNVTWMSEKRA